jgi:hypothetical protein
MVTALEIDLDPSGDRKLECEIQSGCTLRMLFTSDLTCDWTSDPLKAVELRDAVSKENSEERSRMFTFHISRKL